MYKEYKNLNLTQIGEDILEYWERNEVFKKSISTRSKPYTFYEGPPSANGMPGIHHVMARTIKDIFCRYKTLKGFQVKRKGGWDTHGLPIELAVEKALGINKDDIGKKISIKDFNAACRKEVLKYQEIWNDLTKKMGYWVDLQHPYITFDNHYIETLWWILKELYKKGFLYKGYTIQPYSPAAGTGLSSHELNQPGTYKLVKDVSLVAQFRIKKEQSHPLMPMLFEHEHEDTAFLAWTTTPWTLPSNCALAVNKAITYAKVKTFNPYTFAPISVILANDLVDKYFKAEARQVSFESYQPGDKIIPWMVAAKFTGNDLLHLRYHQLMPYVSNEHLEQHAFRVISGDFVSMEEGTGIVHTASVFGADDFRIAQDQGVPSVLASDPQGNEYPLVDKQGRFIKDVVDFAGRFVKEEYYSPAERNSPGFKPTDVLIAIKLKEENKAFEVKKYEHSYPHCWRTDKPLLYYPLDSWFIRTTALKEKLIALNKKIHWKPEATGSGRFGNWLENLVDWNLSRSRFWGTPLPIWRTADASEEICIGSIAELQKEIKKSISAGFLTANFQLNDLHRPYVDEIVLVSSKGEKMFREPDLIDVWFDSGAMPYAQWHYPFENKEVFAKSYPADFIAEGVDQTRGWFFTLHALAVMLNEASDDVKKINKNNKNPGIAFRNVISNGLVLDKHGNKMSKRLGNAIDPFQTIQQHSADVTRWYMISNAAPWDNLKFNSESLDEVKRKFFGTLYNVYAFFALYANIDKFSYEENDIQHDEKPEIDRWVISKLNTLIKEVDIHYAEFEPTKAARAIQSFTDEQLSNWYVRLCRRRFWKSNYTNDKISAYQTLYTCLTTLAKLMSPIAPFFSERLFLDLNHVTFKEPYTSVHLSYFPTYQLSLVDDPLEERVTIAQELSSLILSLRKKMGINVRQPLNKVLVPILDRNFQEKVEKVKELILSETNVKHIEFVKDTSGIIKKKIKPNFKNLGPKIGKDMKVVGAAIHALSQEDINALENKGSISLLNGLYNLDLMDVEISAEDLPGWQVANAGKLTAALDVTITAELKKEGIAREFVNRLQNLRKDLGFEIVDRITIRMRAPSFIQEAVNDNLSYVCAETLANTLDFDNQLAQGQQVMIDGANIMVLITKV